MVESQASILEPPSGIRHVTHWIKERSSWYLQVLGTLVVIKFSLDFGLQYLHGHGIDIDDSNFDYWSDKLFVLVGFGSLLAGAILREYLVSRKERYANIFGYVSSISAALKDLNTYLNTVDREYVKNNKEQFQKSVRKELTLVLDYIAQVFAMVSGTTCRVAIKCAFSEADKLYVYAITRDHQSNSQNSGKDRERFEQRVDELFENEDFYSVFNTEKPWYFERNLCRKRDYRNSSFKVYGSPSRGLGFPLGAFLPDWGWTLPYKSVMVFPVQQKESESLAFDSWGCIGFLAIDSAFGNVFRERFDGPLGASLANALFAPLARYVALLDETDLKGVTHVQKH